MDSRITESVRLLGLIITTKPFEYKDNIVSCSFESFIDINELENIKKNIQDELNNKYDSYTDDDRRTLTDDIYFIDKIKSELSTKL